MEQQQKNSPRKQVNKQLTSNSLQIPAQEGGIRKKSSNISIGEKIFMKQYLRLIQLKEQLLAIRQRKAVIPKVPDPEIVQYFTDLKLIRLRSDTKEKLQQSIQSKRKEIIRLQNLYANSLKNFEEKSQIFKEKSTLQRVLAVKMQTELNKTKERFRQVQFNKVIIQGIRKVLYYRLAEILFNDQTRSLFSALHSEQKVDQEGLGICLGYLGVFISIIGSICGARMWINFVFRGSKSTIRATDGLSVTLHPKDNRLNEALSLLNEQLYQMMHDIMGIKIENPRNFYKLCQQLSKQILSIH